MAVCRGQTILPEDLPELSGGSAAPATPAAATPPADRAEADLLRAVLDAHHWRRGDAARALGISRSTLWRRMREAGLD